jgi:adenosylhomocysteinase
MNELLKKGSLRLKWAREHMPVMREIDQRFLRERPFDGLKIGMALHTEAKTGVLAITLADGGAKICLASCNPLSTDDSVSLALREEYGLDVHAKKGETQNEYYSNLNKVLDTKPDLIIDDGADVIAMVHTTRRDAIKGVRGANEETTTGVARLKSMAAAGKLEFPVISVNDAKMKFLFDNRYGTGQSAFDGWMNSTNLVVAGKRLVVAGYGWCGKGIAMRAKGLGALVTVCEVDPIKAIEARMDGFEVMRMTDAVRTAEIIITATGCKDILREEHFKIMKGDCVMGNAGHFDNEISKKDLERMSVSTEKTRESVDVYKTKDGRNLYLIAEGRLMNLAAGQGHPVEIMDTSFAAQALGMEHLLNNSSKMENKVYDIPESIDTAIANMKLKSMGITIDTLTDDQKKYMGGWEDGT